MPSMSSPDDASGETKLGLVNSYIPPGVAHRMPAHQAISNYSHQRIQKLLQDMALSLSQMNHADIWKGTISNGSNMLDHFRLSLHRPKFNLVISLGSWDRLYYVLLAEVKRLYSDLKVRFNKHSGNGNISAHDSGAGGGHVDSSTAWTAVGMATRLEEMWTKLNDPGLVTALDNAVCARHDLLRGSERRSVCKLADGRRLILDGLMDLSGMTPNEVIDLAWLLHAMELSVHPCNGTIEQDSALENSSVEIRQAGIGSGHVALEPVDSLDCICESRCHCYSLCRLYDECPCVVKRNSIRRFVSKHEIFVSEGLMGSADVAMTTLAPISGINKRTTPECFFFSPPPGIGSSSAPRQSRNSGRILRYVPAGGTIRLEDRQPIDGPPMLLPHHSSSSYTAEDVYALADRLDLRAPGAAISQENTSTESRRSRSNALTSDRLNRLRHVFSRKFHR
ncbi:hypothetical protein K470DRAFT_259728, partial [Piedraia hortae CBS 480.64]